MKNIIYSTLFVLSAFLFSSCNDYLDVQPANVIALASTKDIKTTFNSYFLGISTNEKLRYDPLLQMGNDQINFPMGRELNILTTYLTDDVDMVASHNKIPRPWRPEYSQSVDWKSTTLNDQIWTDNYMVIGFCNNILSALSQTGQSGSNEYVEIYCEAKVLRALSFLNILKYFAPLRDNAYGIPIITDVKVIGGQARLKQTECYKFIIDELKEIEGIDFNATNWNVFYNPNVIQALFAQLYRYKSFSTAAESTDWENALAYSKEFMQGRALLTDPASYLPLFNTNHIGVGFHKNNPYCALQIGNSNTNLSDWYDNGYEFKINPEVISLYNDNDIRKAAFFTSEGWLKKFDISPYKCRNLVTLFRNAEMHLILTEAMAKTGDMAGAKSMLEKFKMARITDFTTYSGDDLIGEIYKERRKELIGENGERWLDQRIFAKGFSRKTVEKESVSAEKIATYTIEDNDYRFTLSIPNVEMENNPKMKQNPGWPLVQ
jgi:hypothetical protein